MVKGVRPKANSSYENSGSLTSQKPIFYCQFGNTREVFCIRTFDMIRS